MKMLLLLLLLLMMMMMIIMQCVTVAAVTETKCVARPSLSCGLHGLVAARAKTGLVSHKGLADIA